MLPAVAPANIFVLVNLPLLFCTCCVQECLAEFGESVRQNPTDPESSTGSCSVESVNSPCWVPAS